MFSELSDRAIAELCGVSHKTVSASREQLGNFPSSNNEPQTRTGLDGKKRKVERIEKQVPTPAQYKEPISPEEPEEEKPIAEKGVALVYARTALDQLGKIPKRDPSRKQAITLIRDWLTENE